MFKNRYYYRDVYHISVSNIAIIVRQRLLRFIFSAKLHAKLLPLSCRSISKTRYWYRKYSNIASVAICNPAKLYLYSFSWLCIRFMYPKYFLLANRIAQFVIKLHKLFAFSIPHQIQIFHYRVFVPTGAINFPCEYLLVSQYTIHPGNVRDCKSSFPFPILIRKSNPHTSELDHSVKPTFPSAKSICLKE